MDIRFSNEIIIDMISIGIGMVALLKAMRVRGMLGGNIRSAMTLFSIALVFFIIAFCWTLVFEKFVFVRPPYVFEFYEINVHHVLFIIGLFFFMISAQKFSSLAR